MQAGSIGAQSFVRIRVTDDRYEVGESFTIGTSTTVYTITARNILSNYVQYTITPNLSGSQSATTEVHPDPSTNSATDVSLLVHRK